MCPVVGSRTNCNPPCSPEPICGKPTGSVGIAVKAISISHPLWNRGLISIVSYIFMLYFYKVAGKLKIGRMSRKLKTDREKEFFEISEKLIFFTLIYIHHTYMWF